MSELKFKLAAGTNVGLVRQNNEDNFIVCPDLSSQDWLIPQTDEFIDLGVHGALLVVADGMGGMNAGEVASALAVDTIQELFSPDAISAVVADSRAIQDFMVSVVKAADLKILNRSQTDSSTQGMGTTVVMAWLLGQRAYVCWCGDSRCYVYNKDRGLMRLSRDHSFVQELVDKGELLPEYASAHPLSNVITRCLGNEGRRAEPETRVYELYDGDTIMLCSDGLCGLCQDDVIADVIHEFSEKPIECKNELISMALAHGGHDNVTVAISSVSLPEEKSIEETSKEAAVTKEKPASDSGQPSSDSALQTDDEEKNANKDDTPAEDDKKAAAGEEVLPADDGEQSADDNEEPASDSSQSGDDSSQPGADAEQPNPVESEKTPEENKKEELSTTLRNGPVKKSRKGCWTWILVMLILVTCCYIAFTPSCAPVRQQIKNTYNTIYQKVNTYFNRTGEDGTI